MDLLSPDSEIRARGVGGQVPLLEVLGLGASLPSTPPHEGQTGVPGLRS